MMVFVPVEFVSDHSGLLCEVNKKYLQKILLARQY